MGPWIKGTYIIQTFVWLQWRIELNVFELSLMGYKTKFFLPGEARVSCQNGSQPL